MSDQEKAVKVSSGVDALIQRLRDEGVADGQARAEKIVAEAEARAKWLINQANEEAEQTLSSAKKEAQQLQKSGTEALQVAARDAMLDLKTRLMARFTGEIQRLVTAEMEKEALLQRLILEVAGRVREDVDQSKEVELLLPKDIVGLEELTRNPEELAHGTLTHFIRVSAVDLIRQGITFKIADDDRGGIRIVLKDQAVILEFTDEAVAQLLLLHLQPRFRALVEGIVK